MPGQTERLFRRRKAAANGDRRDAVAAGVDDGDPIPLPLPSDAPTTPPPQHRDVEMTDADGWRYGAVTRALHEGSLSAAAVSARRQRRCRRAQRAVSGGRLFRSSLQRPLLRRGGGAATLRRRGPVRMRPRGLPRQVRGSHTPLWLVSVPVPTVFTLDSRAGQSHNSSQRPLRRARDRARGGVRRGAQSGSRRRRVSLRGEDSYRGGDDGARREAPSQVRDMRPVFRGPVVARCCRRSLRGHTVSVRRENRSPSLLRVN